LHPAAALALHCRLIAATSLSHRICGFDHISLYRMSGLPEISLDEEIQFLKSVVIPSFDEDREFKTSKERKEWMKVTAKDDGWPDNKAALLNRIYSAISTLDEAKAEKEKLEAKQERLQQPAAPGGNFILSVVLSVDELIVCFRQIIPICKS
jgi:hypothetical protein